MDDSIIDQACQTKVLEFLLVTSPHSRFVDARFASGYNLYRLNLYRLTTVLISETSRLIANDGLV
jgi:hypothetical protein